MHFLPFEPDTALRTTAVVLADNFAVALKLTHSCCTGKDLLYSMRMGTQSTTPKKYYFSSCDDTRQTLDLETQHTGNPRGGGQDQLV